ncbi:hypothetical protein [Dehalococcoides mccartyi]|uniref:hypothetical protein n=1 Tax=Dehalococcoides mccartyi TaxID=61435 RepID=UPI00107EA53F|nr:hypothetical protein [Dehalococcoides mccartyi]QBX63443.1 hypothetical protein DhcFL2_01325 [Dehalococcoides mccartyi]
MGFLKSVIDTYLDFHVKRASQLKDKSLNDIKSDIILTGIMTCLIAVFLVYLCIRQGVFDQLKFYLFLLGTVIFFSIGEFLVLLSVKNFREESKAVPQNWLLGIFFLLACIMQAYFAPEYYEVSGVINFTVLISMKFYLDIRTYRYLKVKVQEGILSIPLK